MKIAYLSTFYPFRGGIAQFNASLYREFEKRHTIKAFTFTRQYPDVLFPGKSQYVTPDDPADAVPAEQILDSINPLSYFKTASDIKRFKPDLLLMKFWMPFFAPSLGFVAGKLKKHGVKIITVLDNVIPHEPRIGDIALTKYFLRRNHGFIAMSKIVENDLHALHSGTKCRLKAHPLYDHYSSKMPVEEARGKLNLPKDKKIILFFGFIRDYKGLDLLIEAMERLDESYHLVVAGEVYGSFDKYQALIDSHSLAKKISLFTRYIADAEVPLFFSSADVCVLPYRSATQSGIVQIAYHYHLPAIVTDIGGLSEMVTDGETGLIIPESSPAMIAEKIKYYFNQNLYEKMSSNIAGNRPKYSWSGFADEIESLYKEIVTES